MSRTIAFRLGEFFSDLPACAFLSEDELVAWCEGRLSADRVSAWEAHAERCDACAEIVGDFRSYSSLLAGGVTVPGERRAFERSDARIRNALGLAGRRRRGRSWWWVPALALAALLVVLILPQRPPMIAEVDRVPLVAPPPVRGSTDVERWTEAERLWTAGEFRRAESVLAAMPDSADAWFYIGQARLERGAWDGAVGAFQEAERLRGDVRSAAGLWALATALDRAGRDDEACAVLATLASGRDAYAERAADVRGRHCGASVP